MLTDTVSNHARTDRPFAIVVALDTMQGLQTARILARRGIPVVAFAHDLSHPSCRTKVCRQIIQVDTRSDDLIEALLSLAETLTDKAVIFPCQDPSVLVISRNRDKLEDAYHVMLAPHQTIEMLMDKNRFYEFALRHGAKVPQTFTLRSSQDADRAAEELTYPCVLKPTTRSIVWDSNTKEKALRANDRKAFLDIYRQAKDWADELMVQQWIDGSDGDLFSFNCYFDRNSRLVCSFVAKKIRQWPPRTGSSCLGEECRNDFVQKEATELFRRAGYKGLGYIEMKRDPSTGTHYMIEANVGRSTGRSAIAEAGGVEMLYSMYCDAVGLPLPAELDQKYQGVKWIDLRHDLQSALYYFRKGELTPRQWLASIRGKKAHAVFSWTDPMPFIADFYRAFKMMLSKSAKA